MKYTSKITGRDVILRQTSIGSGDDYAAPPVNESAEDVLKESGMNEADFEVFWTQKEQLEVIVARPK